MFVVSYVDLMHGINSITGILIFLIVYNLGTFITCVFNFSILVLFSVLLALDVELCIV